MLEVQLQPVENGKTLLKHYVVSNVLFRQVDPHLMGVMYIRN